jgi:hypothetical protein
LNDINHNIYPSYRLSKVALFKVGLDDSIASTYFIIHGFQIMQRGVVTYHTAKYFAQAPKTIIPVHSNALPLSAIDPYATIHNPSPLNKAKKNSAIERSATEL